VAKIPSSMREQLLKLLATGEAEDAVLRRLDAALKPRKRRGRKKPPWLIHRDLQIDILVLQEVLKKPARKASETIARLTGVHPKSKARTGPGREPFKGQGELLSRHNRLLALLKKDGVLDQFVEGIRARGGTVFWPVRSGSFSAEFAAASGVKMAAFFNRTNNLSLPEREEFGRAARVLQAIVTEFSAKEHATPEEARQACLKACRGIASEKVTALTLELFDLCREGHAEAFAGTHPDGRVN
jgi:hypothetical protein